MGVARFEDLVVWQRAKQLSDRIGALIQRPAFGRHSAVGEQIDRAAVPIMANVAEGFVRGRRKEFAQFVRIAAGSNGEVRSLTYAAHGRGYISDGERDELLDYTDQIGRMLRRLIQRLDARGTKH